MIEHSATLVAAAFLLPRLRTPTARTRQEDAAMAVVAGFACGAAILAKRSGFFADLAR